MTIFAKTPQPPYYTVIFTSQLNEEIRDYQATADKMNELAKLQTGFLGIESVRNSNGFGITTSYWKDLESILEWKSQTDHSLAQKKGKEYWYKKYCVRIAKVEKQYDN